MDLKVLLLWRPYFPRSISLLSYVRFPLSKLKKAHWLKEQISVPTTIQLILSNINDSALLSSSRGAVVDFVLLDIISAMSVMRSLDGIFTLSMLRSSRFHHHCCWSHYPPSTIYLIQHLLESSTTTTRIVNCRGLHLIWFLVTVTYKISLLIVICPLIL